MKKIFKEFYSYGGKKFGVAIRKISECNYYFARAFYKYQLQRSQRKHPGSPILIYQMGKVGSKSVERSLRALELDMPIYHPHFLTKDRIVEAEIKRKKYFRTEKYSSLKRPWLYQFLRKKIKGGLDGKKWKIITLTREPIARNLSTFFENLDIWVLTANKKWAIKSDYYEICPTILDLDNIKKLENLFFKHINHNSPLEFFDRELKSILGIDVYASKFPKSKGYKIYKNEKFDVLLIKLENLNECAEQAFKEFLNIEKISLLNSNISSEKVYSLLYQKLKDNIKLPESYLAKMYCSKYMRHFYSEKEIKKFNLKWSRA